MPGDFSGTPSITSANRRGVENDRPRRFRARGFQPVGHEAAQVIGRARLHARRDFLGEQFEQEFGHVSRGIAWG